MEGNVFTSKTTTSSHRAALVSPSCFSSACITPTSFFSSSLWLPTSGARRAFRTWMRQHKIPESRKDCLSIGCRHIITCEIYQHAMHIYNLKHSVSLTFLSIFHKGMSINHIPISTTDYRIQQKYYISSCLQMQAGQNT